MHQRNGAPKKGATLLITQGRTLFGLARTVWSEYERDYARYLAAAMVYYALVSMVPLILLLLSALGLLLRFSDAAALVEQDVLRSLETSLGAPIRATLQDLLDQLQMESVVASAIGLGGLLVAGSKLFKQLRLSFRAIWKYDPPIVSGTMRGVVTATVMEQAASFLILLASGALLVTALVLIAVFQWLGAHLERLPRFSESVAWLLALPVPLIIVTLTFAMLFRFLPPVRQRWRHIWISALVCASGWMIAAEVLTLYGIFFADKFGAWGAIGGLLMILLWMYIVSQVLFYGAELCKVMSSEEMTPRRSSSLVARRSSLADQSDRSSSDEQPVTNHDTDPSFANNSGHSRSLSSWHEAEDSSARSHGPWDEQRQSPARPLPSRDESPITSRRNLRQTISQSPPPQNNHRFTPATPWSVSFSSSPTSERRGL